MSALKLKPNYPLAMLNLAECYTKMQKSQKGTKCFEQAIEAFQAGETALKCQFGLSEDNLNFIKGAVEEYRGRKGELEEL